MEAAAAEVPAKAAATPKPAPKTSMSQEADFKPVASSREDAVAESDAEPFLQRLRELDDRAKRLKKAENEKLQTRVHELFTQRLGQVDLVSGDTNLEEMRVELYEQARSELGNDSIDNSMRNARDAVKRAATRDEALDAIYELERTLAAFERPESARKRKRP